MQATPPTPLPLLGSRRSLQYWCRSSPPKQTPRMQPPPPIRRRCRRRLSSSPRRVTRPRQQRLKKTLRRPHNAQGGSEATDVPTSNQLICYALALLLLSPDGLQLSLRLWFDAYPTLTVLTLTVLNRPLCRQVARCLLHPPAPREGGCPGPIGPCMAPPLSCHGGQ